MVSKAPLSNELYFSPIFDARELRGPSCRPSGQGWEDIIGVPKVWGSVTKDLKGTYGLRVPVGMS